ncbi:hypothetical protein RhiirC2_706009 [Rhizophagus irregularis]|uniref:Uncharacterized protein n=1 Tax=Rhizophagus irregularis TaxID=588596 RepID=A0A2N1NWM6_9GLOM|nr:hypothetical protein RhiirC2_706009 [Rhizophagus irregularis]
MGGEYHRFFMSNEWSIPDNVEQRNALLCRAISKTLYISFNKIREFHRISTIIWSHAQRESGECLRSVGVIFMKYCDQRNTLHFSMDFEIASKKETVWTLKSRNTMGLDMSFEIIRRFTWTSVWVLNRNYYYFGIFLFENIFLEKPFSSSKKKEE